MKYATVADVIAALQKMPQDAPVFGYSETDECDSRIEVVELYTPSQDIIDDFNGQVAEGWDWPEVRPRRSLLPGRFLYLRFLERAEEGYPCCLYQRVYLAGQ